MSELPGTAEPESPVLPGRALYDLRLLESFVALADELHFGRAAERLAYAQPALSQQIRRLESQLGLALFTRDSRRVELTGAGTAFAEHARRCLTQAIQAREAAVAAARGPWDHLALSASMDAIPYVQPLLHGFLAEHLTTQLELVLQSHSATIDAVTRRTSDAAIVWSGELPPEGYEETSALLASPGAGIALHACNQLATRSHLSSDDLRGQRLAMFQRSQNPGLYDSLIRALGGAEQFARVDHVPPMRPGVFKDLVPEVDDITVIPSPVWRKGYEDAPEVVFRPLTPAAKCSIWLIWAGSPTQPAHALAEYSARAAI